MLSWSRYLKTHSSAAHKKLIKLCMIDSALIRQTLHGNKNKSLSLQKKFIKS